MSTNVKEFSFIPSVTDSGSLMKARKLGLLLVYVLMMTGFSSSAYAETVINIRAKGDTGSETFSISHWPENAPRPTPVYPSAGQDATVSTEFETYTVVLPDDVLNNDILQVGFSNDGLDESGQDRNLTIDWIEVDTQRYQSEDPSVYSEGSWDFNSCASGYKKQQDLHCFGGFFQYKILGNRLPTISTARIPIVRVGEPTSLIITGNGADGTVPVLALDPLNLPSMPATLTANGDGTSSLVFTPVDSGPQTFSIIATDAVDTSLVVKKSIVVDVTAALDATLSAGTPANTSQDALQNAADTSTSQVTLQNATDSSTSQAASRNASGTSSSPKAEDSQRVAAVASVVSALEDFAGSNGSFKVPNSGHKGGGRGWFHRKGGVYENSISDTLVELGHLSSPKPKDPLHPTPGAFSPYDFLVYQCEDRIAVFSKADDITPSSEDESWWRNNKCNPYPIVTQDHTYFELSESVASLNTSKDSERVTEVARVISALEDFAGSTGSYEVLNSGHKGTGRGWFHRKGGVYENSISDTLVELGHLSSPLPKDPLHPTPGAYSAYDFLVYRCLDRIAVFSKADGITPNSDDESWWQMNKCNPYPIVTQNHTYFELSEPAPNGPGDIVSGGIAESDEPTVSVDSPEPSGQAGNPDTTEPGSSVEPVVEAALPEPAPSNTPEPADLSSLRVVDTNVSGGGFQSDVTISEDGQTVFSSADVSGIFKSTDGGLRFENRNEGLRSPKVGSLVITADNEQILYAGTGEKGSSGGLFRSTNGGDSWVITGEGDKAQFAGNHSATSDPVPSGHPRSNGDLIVVDEGNNAATYTDDIVLAGTYKDGVRIFRQGGDKEVSAVNTSGFVRSIAYNASLPNTAYAAIQFSNRSNNGIYKIDYTNPSAPISTLEYETPLPEGLTVLSNGHVYGAVGDQGIVKYDGNRWSSVSSGLSTNNRLRQWTAVAGYVVGNNDIVYAGTNNLGGMLAGSNYSNIWRTENGGGSWSSLVDANFNVSDQIHGKSFDWWFRTDAFSQAGLGRTNSVVSSIDVVRGANKTSVSDDLVYVSGRGGIWKSEDGGELWEPAVSNMQATSNTGVAVNPNDPSQVVISNTDYVLLQTSNKFEGSNMSRDKPRGSESRGYDVIFDTRSDELILSVGDRDSNRGGDVFIKSSNAVGQNTGSGWTNTNLDDATSAEDGRARAVTYGYHDGTSATSQTILTAVEGEGVYRYHNGTWSKSRGVNIGSTDRSNFVWPDSGNSGIVFLVDLSSGLYRSNDGGQNWTNIWPSMSFKNNDFFNTGYITADDNDPTTLYLSIQGEKGSPIGLSYKVYRMTGADVRTFGAPGTDGIADITKHSGNTAIKRPGPIVLDPDGNLWLTQHQDSRNSTDAALFVMRNPSSDSSFTDVTTNDYRNIAIRPSGIDVSSDGTVYISQNGTGIVKITSRP